MANGKLSYRWIVTFASGEIKDPSYSRLQCLGKYLGFKIKIEPGPHFNKFTPPQS